MSLSKGILLSVLFVTLASCEKVSTQEPTAELPPTAQAMIVEYLWALCEPDLSGTYCSTYAEYVVYRTGQLNWTWRDFEEVNPLFEGLNQEAFEYLYDQHVRWRDIVALQKNWKREYSRCRTALAPVLSSLRPSLRSKYKDKDTDVLCKFSVWVCSKADLPDVSFRFSRVNTDSGDVNWFKNRLQLDVTQLKATLANEGITEFSGFDCQ